MENDSEEYRTIAIIGGSGLADGLQDLLEDVDLHEYVDNLFGQVLAYYEGFHGDTKVIILPRHGIHGKDGDPERGPAELIHERGNEAHIWQLHELGVEEILAFSATGTMTPNNTPLADKGSFVVCNEIYRGIGWVPVTMGSHVKYLHTNPSAAFDHALTMRVYDAIQSAGLKAVGPAMYINNSGDCFESPSEILFQRRHIHSDNEDCIARLVGMTAGYEAVLAAQVGIRYGLVGNVVNAAAGISDEVPMHEQTLKVMDAAKVHNIRITGKFIESYKGK